MMRGTETEEFPRGGGKEYGVPKIVARVLVGPCFKMLTPLNIV